MAVTLSKNYSGYVSGQTVQLPTPIEAALIAQGYATNAAIANISALSGVVTANVMQGTAAIPATGSITIITNNLVDANSVVVAYLCGAAADATLTYVNRVVPANGSFTIFGNAASTANVLVRWMVLIPAGGLIGNNTLV